MHDDNLSVRDEKAKLQYFRVSNKLLLYMYYSFIIILNIQFTVRLEKTAFLL